MSLTTQARAEVVEFAEQIGAEDPVAVAGGRTRWHAGGTLAAGTRTVPAPAGVRSLNPAEMTVRVGAGTPTAELDAALTEVGQRVNLPQVPGSTVGGALAVGHDDVYALGRGRTRDALLEAVYVSDGGQIVKAGGPTVKNVSGFDLCRLLVGSLGVYGLIGEVVLRTWPRSLGGRWLAGPCDPWELAGRLYNPTALLWDGTTTWAHLEGHPDDLEAETAVAAQLGCSETSGPPALPAHRGFTDKARLAELQAQSEAQFVALIGTGVVYTAAPLPSPPMDETVLALHRRLKAAFDPRGRLNPGRDPLMTP